MSAIVRQPVDFEHVGLGMPEDVVERTFLSHATLLQEQDSAAGRFDLLQVVRRDQHRGACLGPCLNLVEHDRDPVGVEARGRFVQQQKPRIRDECTGNRNPAFHPRAEGPGLSPTGVTQLEAFDQRVGAIACLGATDAHQGTQVAEVFPHREMGERQRAFGLKADEAGQSGVCGIAAEHGRPAGRRALVAGQDPKECRLPRPVGPEHADDLARVGDEGHLAQRIQRPAEEALTVAHAQCCGLDSGFGGGVGHAATADDGSKPSSRWLAPRSPVA